MAQEEEGGQGGTAGDENWGEIMVVDKELLSVKTKPRLRAGVVRGDDPKTDGSNKSYGYVKSL